MRLVRFVIGRFAFRGLIHLSCLFCTRGPIYLSYILPREQTYLSLVPPWQPYLSFVLPGGQNNYWGVCPGDDGLCVSPGDDGLCVSPGDDCLCLSR